MNYGLNVGWISSPLIQPGSFHSFLGVLEWPERGFIYQRTGSIWLRTRTSGRFCKNGHEIPTSIKAVNLMTTIMTSASSFQAKYALWSFMSAGLPIMSTQNYNHSVVPLSSSSMFESRFKKKLKSDYIIFVTLRTCTKVASAPLLSPDSVPEHPMWDLLWKMWQCDRFLHYYLDFSLPLVKALRSSRKVSG
jgi:hypothetical protein